MRLRFTKGINKAVILGMVDQMLANKVSQHGYGIKVLAL
jgi:hypothetical protein